MVAPVATTHATRCGEVQALLELTTEQIRIVTHSHGFDSHLRGVLGLAAEELAQAGAVAHSECPI